MRKNFTLSFSLLFSFFFYSISFSQPFSLLKDQNYGSLNLCLGTRPQPMSLTASGGNLFFTQVLGNLWKSDGTKQGTLLLKEIEGISNMTDVGGILYFLATGALWKSDGTTEGTQIVKSVSGADHLTNADGVLYYSDNAGLWKSDGSEAGTVFIKPLTGVNNLTNVNGSVFFSALTGTPAKNALWKSNGTDAGTVVVKELYTGTGSPQLHSFFNHNGLLYFVGDNAINGPELWKSNGTTAGTSMILDIEPGPAGSNIQPFASAGSDVYFFATDVAFGIALWKTGGLAINTTIVKDLNDDGNPHLLTSNGNELYFTYADGVSGGELWKSDGTGAGTVMVKDIFPGTEGSDPKDLFNLNGVLYFSARHETDVAGDNIECVNNGGELWKSDGTGAGTVMVRDIYKGNGGTGGPTSFTNVNGKLFFKANDGLYGRELWQSDGTSNGTAIVRDIQSTGGSNPKKYVSLNGKAYYIARNVDSGPAFGRGTEIYQTDGTTSGTNQSTWTFTLGGGAPRELVTYKGALYFGATDGRRYELYKSDGAGLYHGGVTVKVKDVNASTPSDIDYCNDPSQIISAGDYLYFSASDPINGMELWRSDGTATGTQIIKNINAGVNHSNPSNLLAHGSVVYFTADNGVDGIELWKTDGTAAGTNMIKDINTAGSSNPTNLAIVGSVLYFVSDDGVNGTELWKSDGTFDGTVLVKNIAFGATGSNPSWLTNVNGVLYFAADDGLTGNELWKSDGTISGTILVKDIQPGITGSNLNFLTAVNGILYFGADDGAAGQELWRSNGTAAGTFLLKDIQEGTGGSNPSILTRMGSNLLFAADNGINGNEVWLTNGSDQGTRLLFDIEPGVNSSNPTELFEFGPKLLIAATQAMVGSETWISDVPAESPLPLELLVFEGELKENDALLRWRTEHEENTTSFNIERSIDGQPYTNIGQLASFNAPGVHHYSFTDPGITALGATNLYYRLKQTDIDGHYVYSNIVVLSPDALTTFVRVYPNPVKSTIQLAIHLAGAQRINWNLIDLSGRTVKSGVFVVDAGSVNRNIPAGDLKAGIYFLQWKTEEMQRVIKVVKE